VDLGRVSSQQVRQATRRAVARALTEDLAGRTDVTSSLTVPVGTRGRAVLVVRDDGVVAGLELIEEVCAQVDHRLEVSLTHVDGDAVRAGTVVAELRGPLRPLLTAERTLLNLVCHLSGIATRTRRFAEALEGTDCVVRDTRKTTPGLRVLEKHAVAVGGGANHRVGLHDAVLVKDNHVAAAGGVAAAARAVLEGAPDGMHVQVEVTSMEEAEEAIDAGVIDLLLDNFTPERLREAVVAIAGRAAVEASGGITLETARAYAEAGADRLAAGALTHSAPSLDVAMDVVEVIPPEHVSRLARADASDDHEVG
jgi:nicotinate-nucleotide pyrophosphorylase (carboxylating)